MSTLTRTDIHGTKDEVTEVIQVMKDEVTEARNAAAIERKFAEWHRLRAEGISFNERLYSNREFHNPNIAMKMLEFMGVQEHGSNFPKALYDPDDFPMDADYESIAMEQRAQWERTANNASGGLQRPPSTVQLHAQAQNRLNERNGREFVRTSSSAGGASAHHSQAARLHKLMVDRYNNLDK